MNLGAVLRQARAARKLTAEQVSAATKIPLRIIAAMEQDEWSKVPSGIFARGYLHAYAREVGLDGPALAAQYDAEQAPPPPPVAENEEAATAPADRLSHPVLRLVIPALPEATRHWVTGTAVAALLIVVYLAGRWSVADGPMPPPEPAATAAAGAMDDAAAQPVGTSAPALPRETPVQPRGSLSGKAGSALESRRAAPSTGSDAAVAADVAVSRPCWVTASADGQRAIYRLLRPGERVPLRGRVLIFRVGDAGALQLTLDGAAARPLGGSGQVVTVQITRENYRSFLATPSGN